MPLKVSRLSEFITDALVNNHYPETLYWCSEEEKTFYLHCVHVCNKTCSEEQKKIFEDWDQFKTRSCNRAMDYSQKRQRFLQALKKSEYFSLIDERSDKSKKLYKFISKNTLIDQTLSSLLKSLENDSSSSQMDEKDAVYPSTFVNAEYVTASEADMELQNENMCVQVKSESEDLNYISEEISTVTTYSTAQIEGIFNVRLNGTQCSIFNKGEPLENEIDKRMMVIRFN